MYFSKYIKYKNKYTTLKKQFGGNDYNISAIEISSPPDQPLQISQLCIYNSNGENIAHIYDSNGVKIAHMFEIEASEPFIRNTDIGSADKAVNGKCKNSNFPDMYHSKNNGSTFKIIFSKPQTYVDIVYYNRDVFFERMNGGKLMLYNDKKNLEFVMTEEKIQIFSNERIKNLLITEHDWNREEINKQKPHEEEKIKRNLYEHKLKEDREKKAIEAKKILDEKKIEIPEGYHLIPTVYHMEHEKTLIINAYLGEQHICDVEIHSNNMILLKILVNNQDLIIEFINRFSKNFDIIYLDIKFNFDKILAIDKYRDYIKHEITNKYIALIVNKPELTLFRQYDEIEGINKNYIDEHLDRVRRDINYCINLMWVSVQPLFSNNFLIHTKYFDKIEMWITNNPNAKIIFWYDGDTKFTTFFSIINTRLFFDSLNSKYPGKIYLRDLSINPFVMKINTLAPFLFGPVRLFNIDDNRLPLYFRVDLYRIIIAIYLLKYEEFTFFVYSDMDIEPYCNIDGKKSKCIDYQKKSDFPLNKEYIFNDEVMSKLDEDGLVMQSMGNIDSRLPSYENSFQIIGNKDPNKKSLIIVALQIYILYENMKINQFGYDNVDWNFVNTNLDKLKTDRNFDTMRNNFSSKIQSVYGSYRGALILFKNLIGKYTNLTESIKCKILESDLFRIHNKEELKLKDEVDTILRDKEENIKIYNFGYFPPSIFIKIFSKNNEGIYKKKYCVEEL